MSKTVIIPRDGPNPWVCTINGVTYKYPAGTTQTVPDAVADIIDNEISLKPRTAPVLETELPPYDLATDTDKALMLGTNGPHWKNSLPDAAGNEGKFLKLRKGVPDWAGLPTATKTSRGLVKQGVGVAEATDTDDVVAQLNALIASLVESGALESYSASTES